MSTSILPPPFYMFETYHTPSYDWNPLETCFEQDDDSLCVSSVTSDDPEVHPIGISLMIPHDDQTIRQMNLLHQSSFIISLYQLRQ